MPGALETRHRAFFISPSSFDAHEFTEGFLAEDLSGLQLHFSNTTIRLVLVPALLFSIPQQWEVFVKCCVLI